MKLIEILKAQGLSDEQINQITTSMKENKVYETLLENADEEYSKMKSKKEEFEGQLETANSTIEKLKKESINKEFSYALRDALKEAGCIDSKALGVYLDKEKLKLEEGKISGLDEQLNLLKESKKYLFEDPTPQNTGGLGNFNRNPGAGGTTESLGERLAKQSTESNQSNQHNYFGGAK